MIPDLGRMRSQQMASRSAPGASLRRSLPHFGPSSRQPSLPFPPLTVPQVATRPPPSMAPTNPPRAGSAVSSRPLEVIVAGAGIGGLVFSLAALKAGYKVRVFERDLTAIRGEGKYRGPIQVQSNALAALEAIDLDVAEEIMQSGCITGDRINGLCDGRTGEWYCKFDTFHPAADHGLPVTRVISRMTLQEVLARACRRLAGDAVIENSATITRYEEFRDREGRTRVRAHFEGGRVEEADVMIAADGIWSKLRTQMVGETKAHFSGYTCYTGISDFLPHDIDTVGYRVFLGNGKYFVSSDVGGGKVQWYGFHAEAPGGRDTGSRKERLLSIFDDFVDTCTDLIRATPEDDVMRRDIFERAPIFQWSEGRVALLGDAAHAMQPNLGQGGCMAIEDAHALVGILQRALGQAGGQVDGTDLTRALRTYQNERLLRVSAIQGMAGMAAYMASTYKTYLGHMTDFERFRIPHPGRMGGKLAMHFTMPGVLAWVLGGNAAKTDALAQRPSACRLGDRPKSLPADHEGFRRYLNDDHLLVGAAHASWVLVHARDLPQQGTDYLAPRGLELGTCFRAEDAEGPVVRLRERDADATSHHHHAPASSSGRGVATVERREGRLYLRAEGEGLVRVNGQPLAAHKLALLEPADHLELAGESYRVKLRHVDLPCTPEGFLSRPYHRVEAAPVAATPLHVAARAPEAHVAAHAAAATAAVPAGRN